MKNDYRVVNGVVYITLRDGVECLVDEADLPIISNIKWFAGRSKKGPYVSANMWSKTAKKCKTIYLHSYLMSNKGLLPDGLVPDHISGDKMDNRMTNLRAVSQRQNIQLGVQRWKKGYTGVAPKYGRFFSQLYVCGKRYSKWGDSAVELAVWYDQESVRAEPENYARTDGLGLNFSERVGEYLAAL